MTANLDKRLSRTRRAAIWLGGILQDAGVWLNSWGWSP